MPACSRGVLPTRQEIKKEIDEAIEKAKAAPVPAAGELWTDIYVGKGEGGPALIQAWESRSVRSGSLSSAAPRLGNQACPGCIWWARKRRDCTRGELRAPLATSLRRPSCPAPTASHAASPSSQSPTMCMCPASPPPDPTDPVGMSLRGLDSSHMHKYAAS